MYYEMKEDKDIIANLSPERLTVATLNVLYPPSCCFFRYLHGHKQRFEYQIKHLFPGLADIICLNEVTSEYMSFLSKNELNYQISEIKSKRGLNSLIMSKHPFDVLINKKRIIFALFKINGVNLILVAAHLCARINNAHVRKRQLEMVENMERTLLEHQ